jgi:2-isopropylmalate synthase
MITDDSLREGMQAPGISFSTNEKILLAGKIAECGINRILISYPSSHKSEIYVTSQIVKKGIFKEVYGLGRAIKKDIDLINSTGSNISLHFPFKYDSLDEIYKNIEYAVSLGPKVEVGVVDITQYKIETLLKIVERLSKINVDTIQLPDTMGKARPELIRKVVTESKKISKSKIEIHCHNDMGFSVSNAIEGINSGADYVDATFLGLGERNGITDMETLCNYVEERGFKENINLQKIHKLNKEFFDIVIRKKGLEFFSDNLPNIGKNIITHTAGTHAAFSDVFEGEHFSINVYTGRAMLNKILQTKGIQISDENLLKLMETIKTISADEGRVIGASEVLKEAEQFVQSN